MKAFLLSYMKKQSLNKAGTIAPAFLRFTKPFSIVAFSKRVPEDSAHLYNSNVDERDKWLDICGHSIALGSYYLDPLYPLKPLPNDYDLLNVLMFYSEEHYEDGPEIEKKNVVVNPMSVDDIVDIFNGNIDDLKKKVGEKKATEISGEAAKVMIEGRHLRIATCAPAVFSKTHQRHLLQDLANKLNRYIIAPNFYTHTGMKGLPKYTFRTPSVQRNPKENVQDAYLYINEFLGDWVLYRPGGDPTAARPYRILGYRDEFGNPTDKSGTRINPANETGVNEYLEICTDHAEMLIEQDRTGVSEELENKQKEALAEVMSYIDKLIASDKKQNMVKKRNKMMDELASLDDYADYIQFKDDDESDIGVKIEPLVTLEKQDMSKMDDLE